MFPSHDPGSASTWALVGVWNLGAPIGRRCTMKYRGDLILLLVDGVYPLSKALVSATTDKTAALTDIISEELTNASALHKGKYGWDMLHYPNGNMVIINVPVQEGSNQEQYAMNTISKAFGHFEAVQANCWALLNDEPYFGGNGTVSQFWGVFNDDGDDIEFDMLQAYSYFRSNRQKIFKMMRPNLQSNGTPEVLMGVNVDFNDEPLPGNVVFTPPTGSLWDVAVWDIDDWEDDALRAFNEWQTVEGVGVTAGPRMKGATNGIEIKFAATDHVYENGGLVG